MITIPILFLLSGLAAAGAMMCTRRVPNHTTAVVQRPGRAAETLPAGTHYVRGSRPQLLNRLPVGYVYSNVVLAADQVPVGVRCELVVRVADPVRYVERAHVRRNVAMMVRRCVGTAVRGYGFDDAIAKPEFVQQDLEFALGECLGELGIALTRCTIVSIEAVPVIARARVRQAELRDSLRCESMLAEHEVQRARALHEVQRDFTAGEVELARVATMTRFELERLAKLAEVEVERTMLAAEAIRRAHAHTLVSPWPAPIVAPPVH